MKHVSAFDLALYTGGELGWFGRLRVNAHLRSCPTCREQVEGFVETRNQVKDLAAGLPEHVDWNRLSSEMTANIHLGLSAGECVAEAVTATPRSAQLTGWHPAGVLAGAVLVVALAWWSNWRSPHIPTNLVSQSDTQSSLTQQGVLLETSSSAIEVNDHGRVMSLMHPKDSDVVLSVSLQGSVRARFVDSESGQVTINNAYVQ